MSNRKSKTKRTASSSSTGRKSASSREPKACPPFVVVVPAGSKYSPKKLNINGSDDPFYRYKVVQLLCQSVGNGKMIKTMLLNLDKVADMLHLEPAYIAMWFGYMIGAQSKYDVKKPSSQRGIVSGEYSSTELSEVFSKLVRVVVICQNCKLPELVMCVSGKGRNRRVGVGCHSCGASYSLKTVPEKFKNYVVNHPPPKRAVGGSAAKKKDKPRTSVDSIGSNSSDDDSPSSGASDAPPTTKPAAAAAADDGDESTLEAIAEAAAAAAASANVVHKGDGTLISADAKEVVWYTDDSEQAVAERQAELVPDAVKQLITDAVDTDADADADAAAATSAAREQPEPERDVVVALRQFASGSDAASIIGKAKSDGVTRTEAAPALFDALLGVDASPAAVSAAAAANADALAAYLADDERAQLALLAAFERLAVAHDALAAQVHAVLHAFYNLDIAEESAVLAWHKLAPSCAGGAKLRATSQPLITWLENAEEESSDDDDSSIDLDDL
jgi:translation initiation factor 5